MTSLALALLYGRNELAGHRVPAAGSPRTKPPFSTARLPRAPGWHFQGALGVDGKMHWHSRMPGKLAPHPPGRD